MTATESHPQEIAPKERRAGRRPSQDFQADDVFIAFGCFENILEMNEVKIEQAMKEADKARRAEPKRRTPDRTHSSDSHDDYHKNFFSKH